MAAAQTAEPDSIAVQELDEVVIEAPRIVRKADMDVYIPSKSAMENSRNGVQLLNNLMIPSLTVSDALGTIQAAGQSVELRINGQKASIDQVRSLLPETIKRVEWLDNPGLRYGGANYVVNFIVTNPTLGGSLMTRAQPALNKVWGWYMADAKFNNGRSQWGVGGYFKLADFKGHRSYNETFTRPDGESWTRTEKPLGGSLKDTNGSAWLSYNYIKPDTTVIMAEMSMRRVFDARERYDGLMSVTDDPEEILLRNGRGNHGNTPTLSLYLQQSLGRGQMFVVDFSSSLYHGSTYSQYREEQPAYGPAPEVTDIHIDIRDQNQAYAVEADYIKNWKNGRLTAGGSYIANRNRSRYMNLGGDIFHQRQDRAYLFAEYFRRMGKWTATVGMGAQYTDFKFRESGRGNHSWSPRPQATVTYRLNDNHNFRLNFTSWQSYPSLAETNIVPQQLDGFQWRIGNQNLHTASSYMLTFRYGFSLPRVEGTFGVRAFTSPDAITPVMMWEGEKLITTYENSRGLRNLSLFLAPQIEVIPNWVYLSGYLQYRMERMAGEGYKHYNNDLSGNVQLQVTHSGFVFDFQYNRSQRDLWGESISWGENISMASLGYNWKGWQFSAGMVMPFGRYDQGSKSLSQWNRNEKHMRINMHMPYIQVVYNLQWGRQKRGAQKQTSTEANADRSTAGGR